MESRGKPEISVVGLQKKPVPLIAGRGAYIQTQSIIKRYLPKVNRAVKPIAAGSKFISVTIFSSGFQSKEILSGTFENL